MRRFGLRIGLMGWLAATVAACGGASPAGPSGLSGGAAINGTIVGASAAASLSALRTTSAATGVPAGLTVRVAGRDISAPVDASGRFALKNVPGGDTDLQFTGGGVDSSVSLDGVQTTETIAIQLSLNGSSVILESEARANGNQEQIEGRVESLPPTMAAGSVTVAGRLVTTDGNTTFVAGGVPSSFAALVIGERVHVKGHTAGAPLLAEVVEIQNTNGDLPVPINGVVEAFTGTAAAFQFTIDGRLIKGDAITEFFGGSAFTDLADGVRAEVKGAQRDGFVFAARVHVNVPDGTDDPEEDESASIEGPLTAMNGSAPVLTLTVGGTTVQTSASTELQRRGDKQSLGALVVGMTLHVVGTRATDGSIAARLIQVKDDEAGGLFEISGPAGGLGGTCPALHFTINGYAVVTDSATVVTPSCTSLKSGNKLTVHGIVQSGGSVLATTVDRQ